MSSLDTIYLKNSPQDNSENRISKHSLGSIWSVSIIIPTDHADSNNTWTNPLPRAQSFTSSFADRGRHIDFNDEQSEKAFASIRVSFDPDSNVNDESDLHEEKELAPRNPTDAGRQTDCNFEQLWKAFDSIRASFDPDSNENDERDVHAEKELAPRNSTDAGRKIDCSNREPVRAFASIRVSFDPDSNVNDDNESQQDKELGPRNPTDAGRESDFKDEQY
jgi:hypothetical protein